MIVSMMKKLDSRLSDEQASLANTGTQISDLSNQVTSQGTQISDLSNQVTSQGTQISGLSNKVASLDDQIIQTDMQILAQITYLNFELIKQSALNKAAHYAHSQLIDRILNHIDVF